MSPTIVRPERSHFRWTVCALLFFATTISYIDRQVLSMLAKTLEVHIGWTAMEYGRITTAFSLAYGIGLLGAGRLLDKFGSRIGFAIAVGLWSAAAMMHAAAATAFTFGVMRVLLGLGEAANFPACIKTVAEWFPKRQRATAAGIFNSGANIGAIATILLVPWMAEKFGWQSAFLATGAIGFIWVAAWLVIYRQPDVPPKLSVEELALIRSDPPENIVPVPWRRVFPKRETWAFALGKFFSDPIWTFFLFWLPKYLQDTYQLSLRDIRIPMLVVYNASTVGSVAGGWLSGGLINRGWSINSARKTAMLICALCVLPVFYVPYANSMWVVVGIISLAMAAHQGWSANLFTTTSDMFPRVAVASVVGIGAALGQVGNALMLFLAGWIVTVKGQEAGYSLLFMICGSAYLVALGVLHLFSPRLEQAKLD
ncbi:MAG: MFS transporter [Candidatus Solibacter sp.]|nr:MFS transporter [Candidatus Solibacter sp.]